MGLPSRRTVLQTIGGLGAIGLSGAPAAAQSSGDDGEWIQLFNGENLDGWTPKFTGHDPGVNYNDTFTVEDGLLTVDYSQYDSWNGTFGHLFYEDEFSHYVLRAEYRFVGDQVSGAPDWAVRNNGLMLHGQTAQEMGIDQDYPDSIEAQLLGAAEGSDNQRTTANVCTPGTDIVMDGEVVGQHCTSSSSDTYRGDEWVTVTIVVRGNQQIRHYVEGDGPVLTYSNPQLEGSGAPINSGTISIQSESHPTQFRSIEVMPVDPDAPLGSFGPAEEPVWEGFTKTQLASGMEAPMAIDVAPDGRVFYTTRGNTNGDVGTINVVDPDSGEITTLLEIDVYISGEDGLQGLVLDPDFEENGWLYTYYSVPQPDPEADHFDRLSRFTVEDGSIDPSSEAVILTIPSIPDPIAHVGADLEFGPEGNLFLSTGDDTSPFESSGFTPIDEREGREGYDAQRTAANTADLKGKILRITPQDDGSYTIPDGNFKQWWENETGESYSEEKVRPEIYVMGSRNPFRMGVDEDGVLYWGNYGPDSGSWDAQRGPPGIVEFNRAEEPGFYGWPYFVGPNIPFVDYDFETGESGEPFDPENPVNDSPNNDGLTQLPPPTKPEIWYPYSWDVLLSSPPEYAQPYLPEEPPYPEFEGGAPMGGPVYDADKYSSDDALPNYFDNRQFIAEWAPNAWIRTVSYTDDGEVADIDPFMPNTEFLRPMDMTIGPDGAFYLLEWGSGYGAPNDDSGIYRITGGAEAVASVSLDSSSVGQGESTTATVTVRNTSESELTGVEVSLTSDSDQVEITAPSGTSIDSIAAGESASVEFDVAAVSDAGNGTYTLNADVTYTHDGDDGTTSATTTVTVFSGGNLDRGLEAHFTLDDDTPTNEVTDTDATISGDVTTGQEGIAGDGTAYEFHVDQETGVEIPPSEATAGDGVMTEPLPLNGEAATVAAWMNFTDHEQWGRAPFQVGGSLADAPNGGWNMQFESNEESLRTELWDGGSPSNGSGGTPISVDPETWYFVVAVVDGGDTRVHVFDQDGELDSSPQTWTGGSRTQSESAPLNLGVGQGYDMAGRVDDVWGYSRALSESEAEQLYTRSLEGEGTAGRVAHFTFDDDTPTNEVSGTDATISGDVTTGQEGIVGNSYEFHVDQETGVEIPPSEATAGDGVMTEPLPLNGEAATAAAWINFTDHEQWGRAPFQVGGSLADAPNGGWNVQFQSNEESLRTELWDGGSPSNGSGGTPISVDPETWYYVVMVVDGGDARLHVFDQDGELDSSPQTWTGGSRTQSDLAPMAIGVGQGYDMAGRVDELSAYSRALSESEVQDVYAQSTEGDGGGGPQPTTTFELGGQTTGWVGQAPSSIEGATNPTLEMTAGQEYTVTWENLDGNIHDFHILDSQGNEIPGTGAPPDGYVSEVGATASVTFTATEEMAEYYCSAHATRMRGDVSIDGGGGGLSPVVGDAPPTDPNGDGLYEDVNGDGEVTYADVVDLFENFDSAAVQDNPEAFDFNGNGRLDFDDVITLFRNL